VRHQKTHVRYVDGIYRGAGVWKLVPLENGTRIDYEISLQIMDRWIARLSKVMSVGGLH